MVSRTVDIQPVRKGRRAMKATQMKEGFSDWLIIIIIVRKWKCKHFAIESKFYSNLCLVRTENDIAYAHLNQNTLKRLAHRHTAKFDNKIAELETGTFRFNLEEKKEIETVDTQNENRENQSEDEKDRIRFERLCNK